MKSMNKSFLGASIILAVLSGCASKQAQQPELTPATGADIIRLEPC